MKNNSVYKGYSLNAVVSRLSGKSTARSEFTATLSMVRYDGSSHLIESLLAFPDGGSASTPGAAIDAAIMLGRQFIDGLSVKSAVSRT